MGLAALAKEVLNLQLREDLTSANWELPFYSKQQIT